MYITQLHAGHWYICQFTSSTLPSLDRDLDRAYDTRAEALAALAEYHRRRVVPAHRRMVSGDLAEGRKAVAIRRSIR